MSSWRVVGSCQLVCFRVFSEEGFDEARDRRRVGGAREGFESTRVAGTFVRVADRAAISSSRRETSSKRVETDVAVRTSPVLRRWTTHRRFPRRERRAPRRSRCSSESLPILPRYRRRRTSRHPPRIPRAARPTVDPPTRSCRADPRCGPAEPPPTHLTDFGKNEPTASTSKESGRRSKTRSSCPRTAQHGVARLGCVPSRWRWRPPRRTGWRCARSRGTSARPAPSTRRRPSRACASPPPRACAT